MRPPRRSRRSVPVVAAILALALALAGCATSRQTVTSSAAAGGSAPPPAVSPASGTVPVRDAAVPGEATPRLRLSAGQTWKSRIVSTSDTRWVLKDADGKTEVRSRTMGIEIVSRHTVTGVAGTVATVTVEETSVRILRDGAFVDAPFRQFDPPATVAFTVDAATGKADFGAVRKAYVDWIARVRQGPAGEILGRTFRAEDYAAQLEELYGKPLTRFAGPVPGKGAGTVEEKEFLLPFAGPGTSIPPIPVTWTIRAGGAEAGGTQGGPGISGSFGSGSVERTSREEAARIFAEFDRPVPAGIRRTGEARGQFRSTLDPATGRELRTDRRFTYTTTAAFDNGALSGEVSGKLLIEPAE